MRTQPSHSYRNSTGAIGPRRIILECMKPLEGEAPKEPLIGRATGWLNGKLYPYLGPPPLGPYSAESTEPVSHRACPLCGYPMSEHLAEVSPETGHIYLHHPDAAVEGVMEVG